MSHVKNEEVVVDSEGSLRWRHRKQRRRNGNRDKGNGVKEYNQDTGDLMPARRKTCLKPTSAVKAQAFAPLSPGGKKVVPYDEISNYLQ